MTDDLRALVETIRYWERVEAFHHKRVRQARAVLYRLRSRLVVLP
jgi:hypothetical protein